MSEARGSLDREEVKITGRNSPEFWEYVNAHKKMMQKCMIATARQKAGIPLDAFGIPFKSYTNQSESINNKLTRQKEAMVKNEKSKVNFTKLQFTRDVWEEVDKHQQEELQLAICLGLLYTDGRQGNIGGFHMTHDKKIKSKVLNS